MNSRLDWLVLSDYYSIYVTNAPPLVNNTNPDDKLEFVLFFSNEYFGIKVRRGIFIAIARSVNSYKSLTKLRDLDRLWRNIMQSVKNLSRLGRRKCEIIWP